MPRFYTVTRAALVACSAALFAATPASAATDAQKAEAKARLESMTPEQREAVREKLQSLTPEQKAEAKARWEAMTPEERAKAKERLQSVTPEQKAAARARWDAMTPEEQAAARQRHSERKERRAGDGVAK
jgi:chlorite dismutase